MVASYDVYGSAVGTGVCNPCSILGMTCTILGPFMYYILSHIFFIIMNVYALNY